MTQHDPIPVPLPLLMRRVRYQVVPVLTLLISAILAGWLWMRHAGAPMAVGEVNATRTAVASHVDGTLVELARPVGLFDAVVAGQVIGQVDTPSPKGQLGPQIKAPISGTVVEIRRRPGEIVRAGQTIVIIAADRGEYIVGYVRQDQAIRPAPGMDVDVRPRELPRRIWRSHVRSVGPQVERVPDQQLRDHRTPEWGVPVQVAMPPEAQLRPGVIVDLIFHP